jgi:hypothetical protein
VGREVRNSTGRSYEVLAPPGHLRLLPRNGRKLKPPKPVYVRLEAPQGIGSVQTFSGRHITIGEDRIIEMSTEDADCLIRAGWTKLAE